MRMRFLDDRLEVRAAHSQATKTKPPAISSAGRCGYSLQFPPFLPVFFESCPSAVQPCTHALPAVRCSAHSGAGVCTPAVHFSARARCARCCSHRQLPKTKEEEPNPTMAASASKPTTCYDDDSTMFIGNVKVAGIYSVTVRQW
jgi:hypothetical protein